MTVNLFEHTHAHWAKYSDYEWRTAPDGHDYLLPTTDAKPSVYDPIRQADALVVEAVNIGLLLFHKASDAKLKGVIRGLCPPVWPSRSDDSAADHTPVCGV